jgi:hypothetical protein
MVVPAIHLVLVVIACELMLLQLIQVVFLVEWVVVEVLLVTLALKVELEHTMVEQFLMV